LEFVGWGAWMMTVCELPALLAFELDEVLDVAFEFAFDPEVGAM
jgi:hypothetical protein